VTQPETQQTLSELARVKAQFQLRAIAAALQANYPTPDA
jgi:hypothetical protein